MSGKSGTPAQPTLGYALEQFGRGLAVGAVKGLVQYQIAQLLDKLLGDDMNPALKQAITGVISSVAAEAALMGFAVLGDEAAKSAGIG